MACLRVAYYKYRDDLFKRVIHYPPSFVRDLPDKPRFVCDKKTADNIRRAQRNIEALALCNDWDYWVTLTLDPNKVSDRSDLEQFRKDLMQFIRDQRKKFRCRIDCLFVPELHKSLDGWHMHGLICGLPLDALRLFSLSEKLPYRLRDKILAGDKMYDWPDYRNKFGYCSIEKLKNRDAASRYMTKYVTKGLKDSDTPKHIPKGSHLYFCTRGLNRPQLVEEDYKDLDQPYIKPEIDDALDRELDSVQVFDSLHHKVDWDFSYDYGRVTWLKPLEDDSMHQTVLSGFADPPDPFYLARSWHNE